MTDSDDKLRRAYRDLAREEPSTSIDAAILRKARARHHSLFSRYAGPMSIAAVLVLGIGISLRMQLEQPGVETSVPQPRSADAPAPQGVAPPPEPIRAEPAQPPAAAKEAAKPAPQRPAADSRGDALRREATPVMKEKKQTFTPEPPAMAPPAEATSRAPAPAPLPAAEAPASSPMAAPPAPAARTMQAAPSAPAAQSLPAAPSASLGAAAPAPRAKREAEMDSTGSAAERRKSLNAVEADADPVRELERIAKLRDEGRHADADKALEEFRRRRPDFRIPETLWQRVRPPG